MAIEKVFLAGLMARELGGQFAQATAAVAALIAPISLGVDTLLTMNALDQLLWVLAFFKKSNWPQFLPTNIACLTKTICASTSPRH